MEFENFLLNPDDLQRCEESWADIESLLQVPERLDLNLELDFNDLPDFLRHESEQSNPETEEALQGDTLDAIRKWIEEETTGNSKTASKAIQPAISYPVQPNHATTVNIKKKYKCKICHKTIGKLGYFRFHLLTHAKKEIDAFKIANKIIEKGSCKCPVCHQRLTHGDNIDEHLEIHKEYELERIVEDTRYRKVQDLVECNTCGKWVSKEHFATHQKKHEDWKTVRCTGCGQRFPTPWKLWEHMKVHESEAGTHNMSYADGIDAVLNSIDSWLGNDAVTDEITVKFERSDTVRDVSDCELDEFLDEEELAFEILHCGDCGKHIESQSSRHDCQPPERPFCCGFCARRFKYQYTLEEHQREHTGEKPFICDVCEKGFRRKTHLCKHLMIHYNKKQTCGICNKKMMCLETLQRHMLRHVGVKPKKLHSCVICLKKFAYPSELRVHMRIHTGERFHCDTCKRQFLRRTQLIKHLKCHEDATKKLHCHYCSKLLKSRDELRTHMINHTEKLPYVCNVCGKSFRVLAVLKSHHRTHTGEKPFACELCPKSYRHASNLIQHRRMHSDEKPYACELCEKRYRQSCHLTRHQIRAHADETPFTCTVCNRGFACKFTLDRHYQVHRSQKGYACSRCGGRYSTVKELMDHKRLHPEKPYQCLICEKRFDRKTYMVTHMELHSGAKAFACHLCEKTFKIRRYLQRHLQWHEGKVKTSLK